jgi:hypothetical protein
VDGIVPEFDFEIEFEFEFESDVPGESNRIESDGSCCTHVFLLCYVFYPFTQCFFTYVFLVSLFYCYPTLSYPIFNWAFEFQNFLVLCCSPVLIVIPIPSVLIQDS